MNSFLANPGFWYCNWFVFINFGLKVVLDVPESVSLSLTWDYSSFNISGVVFFEVTAVEVLSLLLLDKLAGVIFVCYHCPDGCIGFRNNLFVENVIIVAHGLPA